MGEDIGALADEDEEEHPAAKNAAIRTTNRKGCLRFIYRLS
jgi:hypothetical protein